MGRAEFEFEFEENGDKRIPTDSAGLSVYCAGAKYSTSPLPDSRPHAGPSGGHNPSSLALCAENQLVPLPRKSERSLLTPGAVHSLHEYWYCDLRLSQRYLPSP